MLRITGRVTDGLGKASVRLVGERLERRNEAIGVRCVPGTLNVRMDNRPRTLRALGNPPVVVREPEAKDDHLKVWPGVEVWIPERLDQPVVGAIVRGSSSRSGSLEIMAGVRFRDMGVANGDRVEIRVP